MYGYVSFKAETYEIVDGNNQSITWQQLLESKYAEISATDTECMNITANLAGGAYWTTFYHKEKDFIAPMGT